MKRRTLLKTALALPMTQATALAPAARETSSTREDDSAALFSGLPGLDYALGGIRTGELICIAGLPSTGKTLLLMDLAARICGRYGKNVVFYSAHQPSVYLGKKGTIKAGVRFGFADVRLLADSQDREFDWRPAVILLDSTAATLTEAIHVAQRTETEHPARCAVLIVDGWSTTPGRWQTSETADGAVAFPAERWAHTLLSVTDLRQVKQFGQTNRIPVVVGVTTASLVDDPALAESFHLSTQMRLAADRLVTLHRPELYVETSRAVAADRNVVCLSGTSPRWWDTRCSRLRFEPRRLGFSTVI